MIVLLTILVILSLAPACFVGFKKKRYYFPFLLVLLYYCVQIPLMLGNLSIFTESDIYASSLYVLCCNATLTLILLSTEARLPEQIPYKHGLDISQGATVVFILALVFVVIYVVNESGINLEENTWARREENYFSLYGPIISYCGFLIFGLWTILRTISLRILLLPVLALIFLSTGARVIFMVIFGAFWLFALRKLSRRQMIVFGGLAGLGFIGLHIVTRVLRSVSLASLLSGDLSVVGEALAQSEDLTGGDGSIGEGFVLAMQGVRDQTIVTAPLATITRLLLLPLPSTVVPFKPDDVTYRLWRYGIESGYFDQDLYFRSLIESYSLGQNGSLHPILWGDALLNAGWLGCLIWPALFAALLIGLERLVMSRPDQFLGRMSAAVAAPGLIYVVRGNVFIGIVIMLIPILFSVALLQAKRIFAPRQVLAAT
jgi:hypothetical protein